MFNDQPGEDYAYPADDEIRDSSGDPVREEKPERREVLWDADDGGPGQDYNSAFQDLLNPW